MKVLDLEGPALDYWFEQATGEWKHDHGSDDGTLTFGWEEVGRVLEREKITLFTGLIESRGHIGDWLAIKNADFAAYSGEADLAPGIEARGTTPLIAVMRCAVLAKFGDEVEDTFPRKR